MKLAGAASITQLSLLATAAFTFIPWRQIFATPTVFSNSKTGSTQVVMVVFSSIAKWIVSVLGATIEQIGKPYPRRRWQP